MQNNNYRGQRKDTKEWVYGYLVECIKTGKSFIFPVDINESVDIGANGEIPLLAIEVIPETVGQSPGIPDKNGKEIYKGDLIEVKTEKYHFISEITWDNTSGSYEFQDTKNTWCGLDALYVFKNGSSLYGGFAEVIGNIYDNPELLQEVELEK